MRGKVRFHKSASEIGNLLIGGAIIAIIPGILVGLPLGWWVSPGWGWIALIVGFLVAWGSILLAAFQELGNEEGIAEGECDEQGYRHGTWKWRNAEGKVTAVIDYAHGRRHGQEIRYHPDGTQASQEYYLEDRPEGHFQFWWPSGRLRCDLHYQEGRLHGPLTTYVDEAPKERTEENTEEGTGTGLPRVKGDFVRGEAHGRWRWWRSENLLLAEAHYQHGTPHGVWRVFDEQGEVRKQAAYVAGIQRHTGFPIFADRLGVDSGTADDDLRPPLQNKGSFSWFWVAVIGFAVLVFRRDPFLIAPIAILMAVIAIHELGHFLIAKLVGIPISSFRIGVGPTLFRYQWGMTKYELGLVPVMGYVAEYRLRPAEWTYAQTMRKTKTPLGDPTHWPPLEETAEEQRVSGAELRHPVRRIPYYLGGVAFNFAAAWLMIWVAGWLVPASPDGPAPSARNPLVALEKTSQFSWLMLANTPRLLAPMFQSESYTEYRPGAVAAMKQSARRAAERVSNAEQQSDSPELRRQARSEGVQEILIMFASINLILVWFNVLPIPPLDGYHVVSSLGEVFVGRRLMTQVRRPLQAVGVVVILLLIFTSVFFILRDMLFS